MIRLFPSTLVRTALRRVHPTAVQGLVGFVLQGIYPCGSSQSIITATDMSALSAAFNRAEWLNPATIFKSGRCRVTLSPT